ncbi:MAG: hypothetical protein CVU56_26725 [Deltaproteobacteria bacterium HGW-Deltaproteobacteria-14]|jgi:hypothetical protein|nr:MAG: hypothetical protein CVU56_26725 [Deltaproteobacteria bacterium HGW-Deltaproteobacteria-14]
MTATFGAALRAAAMIALAAMSANACVDGFTDGPGIGTVVIRLPELPAGADFACMDLRVTDAATGALVWSRGAPEISLLDASAPEQHPICSDVAEPGHTADGPRVDFRCNAHGPTDQLGMWLDTGRRYTVTAVVDGLYTGRLPWTDDGATAAIADPYAVNPCPAPGGCSHDFVCAGGETTLADFNFDWTRDAEREFLDGAVTLGDLGCQATASVVTDPDGRPAARLDLRCATRADTPDATLYLDDLVVACADGAPVAVSPVGVGGAVAAPSPNIAAASFPGVERDDNLTTCSWHAAIALAPEATRADPSSWAGCTLTTRATASRAGLALRDGRFAPADGAALPWLDVSVPLTDVDGASLVARYAIDAPGSAVALRQDAPGAGFQNRLRCGAYPEPAQP